ncbi:hypothetical protein Holit_03232 [Hollandina sp. SP2]
MNGGNALEIVKGAQEKGALVFANIENMVANVDLYRTEVTILKFNASDFYVINGKYMPNRAATDRIGEACGVQFIRDACRVTSEIRDDSICEKRTVHRGEAQGKVRMPDGSWRTSTVDEYEFDPVLRAMLDKNITELNEQTKKTVGRAILECTKVARQRAATGARLRVIRQLTGMPAAFEKDDAFKTMVFTRVVQNTKYILNTPEGRAMATAQALGVDMSTLFGGRKLPNPVQNQLENHDTDKAPTGDPPENKTSADNGEVLAAEAAAVEEPDFPDEPADKSEFDDLTDSLQEFVDGYKTELDVTSKSGTNPYKSALRELENKNATEDTRRNMISRLRKYLQAKGINI